MKLIFTLLITTFYSLQGSASCDLTINPSQDIQTSLNSIGNNRTLCLTAGIFYSSTPIKLINGQRLTGVAGNVTTLESTILSSADRIITLDDNTQIDNFNLGSSIGTLSTYGVLTYYDYSPKIWNLNIKNTKIAIGVVGSSYTDILNVYISLNGDIYNNNPDPAIWINNTLNTTIWYGHIVGRKNGVYGSQGFLLGDGEVGCYDSNGLTITGTRHDNSGTSAFYLVNCDNAVLDRVTVFYADGFGLDIVDGTDNLVVKNSNVYFSELAASVFDGDDNGAGSFINNTFYNNNTTNNSNCSGVTIIGNQSNLILSGNTIIPSPQTCPF